MHRLEPHISHKQHLIWDWNGTLLDDVDVCVEVIGELLNRYERQPISRESYRQLFGFPVRQYYRGLGFDFDEVSFEELSAQFHQLYNARLSNCRLFTGCHELFQRLSTRGIASSVLSAAHEPALKCQLDAYHLTPFFQHVYGTSDHYAHGKIERGRELLAAIARPPAEILMIGDTDHDLEVARALGIDILLIADGHQSFTRLRAIHPLVLETRN